MSKFCKYLNCGLRINGWWNKNNEYIEGDYCEKHLDNEINNTLKLKDNSPQWANEWISVKDRLPDYSQPYLVKIDEIYWPCVKYFKLSVIDYAMGNSGFFCTNANSDKRTKLPITHWMPLPEPPK